MKDCSFEKIPCVINNDNLDVFNQITVFLPYHTDASDSKDRIYLRLYPGETIHVKADSTVRGGTYPALVGESEFDLTGSQSSGVINILFNTKVSGVTVTIDNPYAIRAFSSGFDIVVTKGLNSLLYKMQYFDVIGQQMIFDNLGADADVVGFVNNHTTYKEFMDALSDKSHLKVLKLESADGRFDASLLDCVRLQEIYGFVGDLSSLPTSIRNFVCTHSSGIGMTGSLEDFVGRLRAAGRTTGAIKAAYMGSASDKITYDGGNLKDKFTALGLTNKSDNFFVWTADSITLTDNTSTATAAGYTAPEGLANYTVE